MGEQQCGDGDGETERRHKQVVHSNPRCRSSAARHLFEAPWADYRRGRWPVPV